MSEAANADLADQAIQTVLVVDDSKLQRQILYSLLSRWGMRVHQAESGEQALEILATQSVDLVLSDWIMPGISGVELCRTFRTLDLGGYVYFVLLTSKTEKSAVSEGLLNGADDFLIKPISSEELRARIKAADRIIRMERELKEKNRLVSDTLSELRRAHDALDRDLIEARRLQQSLVPRQAIRHEGAEISFLFQPSGHVGGDLVGVIPVSDRRFGLYSLDVSGHGIASAMITARLATTLGSSLPEQNAALIDTPGGIALRDPADTCARLNAQYLRDMETDYYFTLAVADVDLDAQRVLFAQAGHPNPLLQSANGDVRFVGEGGLPIGLIDDAAYDTVEVGLSRGDRLFFYSDGVTECPAPDGSLLDEDGLQRQFETSLSLTGSKLLDALKWQLNAYLGGQHQPDDVSGVLLEIG